MSSKQEQFREVKRLLISILDKIEDGTSVLEVNEELSAMVLEKRMVGKGWRNKDRISSKYAKYISMIGNVAKNNGFTLEGKTIRKRYLLEIDGEEVWHDRITRIQVLRRDNNVNN